MVAALCEPQALGEDLALEFDPRPLGEWHATTGGELTGQRFDGDRDAGGKSGAVGRP